jgi:membrane-anchored mycosin MYCP
VKVWRESALLRHSTRLAALLLATATAATCLANPAFAETRRQRQWYLENLNITQVQKVSRGQGVTAAVVDSGVDCGHPDLAGQTLRGVRVDGQTGDGCTDADGHGTHMASIIAATAAGTDGVLGIAPGVKILPVKTSAGTAGGDVAALKAGIRAAADNGAKVINLSVSAEVSAIDTSDIEYALSKDAVVVAAAGNTSAGQTKVMWPARVPGVIAVTGYNKQGTFWSGSAQGAEAVISAPAEDILAASSRSSYASGYTTGNGTSDATAIVSAIVALIRAKYPNLNAASVINRLISTADDAGPPGRDSQYGFGKVNPLKALTATVSEVTANPLVSASAGVSATGTGDPLDQYTAPGSDTPPGFIALIAAMIAIGVGVVSFIVRAITRRLRRRRG